MARRLIDGKSNLAVALAVLLGTAFAMPAAADIDLAGSWGQLMHEDRGERGPGPDIGDYLGLPLNEAAFMRADTWDANKWSVPEHQCEPHPADYAPHGPAHLRVASTVDPLSQKVVAWHITHSWMVTTRIIHMDGREHPPAAAPHSWMGFSTGQWVGDTLQIRTTHLKEGWARRNGSPRSDEAVLTEFISRNGDYLTWVSIVEDPIYLTEPLVRSWNWKLNTGYQMAAFPCSYRVETERPKGWVAHWFPGTNPQLTEFAEKHGLSQEGSRSGAATMYPEYRKQLD